MNILKLAAQLTLDGRGFRAGMKEAQSSAKTFGKEISSALVGAFGTAAMVSFVRGIVSASNHVKDLSEQFNVTTDEVQKFQKAASEAGGLAFEDIGQALTKLGNARDAASTSNDKLLETFNKYGVTLAQLQNPQVRNIDLMHQLTEAMQNLSETDRHDLVDLFGKAGGRLAEVFKAIKEQGPIELIKKEDIDAIDKLSESLDELKRKAMVAGSGPIGTGANILGNIFGGTFGHIKDEEKKMLKEFEGEGYLKFGKDKLGTQMVWDVVNSRTYGTEKEQREQEAMLRSYYNKKHGIEPAAAVAEDAKKTTITPEITPETSSKLLAERDKLEKQLAEAAVKYRLSEAKTEYQKRSILETELQKHAAAAAAQRAILGEDGISAKARLEAENNALTEDLQVAGLLSQISAMSKSSALDVASLTQSGQIVTGRNSIVSQAESATVQEIRKLLGFNKTTAEATKGMAEELKKNPPIRVAR